MQCAGAFITAPWGGGDVVGLAHDIRLPDDLRFGVVTSPAEVRDRVRRLLIGGADLIKCIGTGAVLTRGGVPRRARAVRGRAARRGRGGRRTTARSSRSMPTRTRAPSARSGPVRGRSSTARCSTEDAIRAIADAGTFLSVDVFDGEWALEHGVEERWPAETMRKLAETMETGEAAFRRAIELGVRITYGTDSGVYPHELSRRAWTRSCAGA